MVESNSTVTRNKDSLRISPFSPSSALENYSFWKIFWLGIVLSLHFVSCTVANEDLVCQKGVSGFPGATFPRGDILLKEGDTLEVYCRLDLRRTKYNATFIKFVFTKTNISEDLMRTTVINETTALLRVERMNVSSSHLSCEIVPPGLPRIQVCQNEIDVGFSPMKVENFRCIAPEWRSLYCTWTKPYNSIPTNYAVQILQKTKSYTAINSCPNTTATPTSCLWGPRTEPFYRQNLNPLHFRVNGTNALNPGGSTWDISIEHWSIVVPGAPTDLKVHPFSPDVVTISWAFKDFKDFVPGLVHQVTVCIQNFTVPCNVTRLDTYKGSGHRELNISLDYAYVNYTVEIMMRSQRAKNESSFWSNSSVIVVPSEAKKPSAPPKVAVGSYESVPVSEKKRDVFVYWEDVPPLSRNGPEFHYVLSVLEDEEMKPEIQPKEVKKSYAKFTGLGMNKSYRFQILSANSVGNSTFESSVYVPRIPKAPDSPKAVSKLDFNNGSYTISWNPVNAPVPIVSYTVFRCESTRPKPYQCQGMVKWDEVNADKQSKVYDYLPHENIVYQFAVAANAESMSSGMAWATCELIHGKVPDKLRKPTKTKEGEKEIHIEWQLDCSYKPGVIDGYKISYCRVEGGRNKSDRCIDDVKQEAVSGANITEYYLKKLQPCSRYMIYVSIISINGESQKSDAIYATTKPGAPSNPPIVNIVKLTNTTATISIKPQPPLNGVVKDYRVQYKSLETNETIEKWYPVYHTTILQSSSLENVGIDSCFEDGTIAKSTEVEIPGLLSNSNYSFTAAACTSRCSDESELVYFKTNVGHTDMTKYPDIKIDGEDIVVLWTVPTRIRGPITEFQILLKQNGKSDEIVSVPYKPGTNATSYHHKMTFSCETNSNLTAQVRAVTNLNLNAEDDGDDHSENGVEVLYGRWSPAGNFNCGGGASWIIWVAVVIGIIIIIFVIGVISSKVYQKLKAMKEVNVKLPPGLAVQDLNGFSHSHTKRRRDSDGDTQSFGKENLTYQMTTTHHSDDSKDFASLTESCLQQENAAGFLHRGEMSFDNKVYLEELEVNSNDISDPGGGTQLFHTYNSKQISSSKSPLNVENESLLIEKRTSPTHLTTNPLLEDSSITTEEEEDHLPIQNDELYSNVQVQELFDASCSRRNDNVSPAPFSSSPYPPIISRENSPPITTSTRVTVNILDPEERPQSNNNPPPGGLLPAPTNPSTSSYVKWTQMLPDQFINGDSNSINHAGIDHGHQTPYCHVGILLDSN